MMMKTNPPHRRRYSIVGLFFVLCSLWILYQNVGTSIIILNDNAKTIQINEQNSVRATTTRIATTKRRRIQQKKSHIINNNTNITANENANKTTTTVPKIVTKTALLSSLVPGNNHSSESLPLTYPTRISTTATSTATNTAIPLSLHHGSKTSSSSNKSNNNTTIPQRLLFIYIGNENFFETKSPAILYDNVQNTIQLYQQAWNYTNYSSTTTTTMGQTQNESSTTSSSSMMLVEFLTGDDCATVIHQTYPMLLNHFWNESRGAHKSDICRVAKLYQSGGYYFDNDMETIRPMIVPPHIEFATAKNGPKTLSQSFLASTPRNPILKLAMDIMLQYYQGTCCQKDAYDMGTRTLRIAHQHYYYPRPKHSKNKQDGTVTTTNDATNTTATATVKSLILSSGPMKKIWNLLPNSTKKQNGRGRGCNRVVYQQQDNNGTATIYFFDRIPGVSKLCRLLKPASLSSNNTTTN